MVMMAGDGDGDDGDDGDGHDDDDDDHDSHDDDEHHDGNCNPHTMAPQHTQDGRQRGGADARRPRRWLRPAPAPTAFESGNTKQSQRHVGTSWDDTTRKTAPFVAG